MTVTGVQGDVFAKATNGEARLNNLGGAVEAESTNGSLHVGITHLDGANQNSFKAINGSLQVSLPEDVSGTFAADTMHGSIKIEFPLKVNRPKYCGEKTINAQLGSGGSSYPFSTVNGSIKILEN